MNAHFSPDGEHIAFTGPNYFGLWVADYSQQDSIYVTNMRKLISVQAGFGYDWSLDGEWILSTHHVYRDRKKMRVLYSSMERMRKQPNDSMNTAWDTKAIQNG